MNTPMQRVDVRLTPTYPGSRAVLSVVRKSDGAVLGRVSRRGLDFTYGPSWMAIILQPRVRRYGPFRTQRDAVNEVLIQTEV